MCYLPVKRSGERATRLCSLVNQSVDTSFFTGEKYRMTNQLASLAKRDYFYLDAFCNVNLGMYIYIYMDCISVGPKKVVVKASDRLIILC